MSDNVPKSGGGFLKGFFTGSAVSVVAICASWVFLPAAGPLDASVPPPTPADPGTSSAVSLPQASSDGKTSGDTDQDTADTAVAKPSELDSATISPADDAATVSGTSTTRPQVPAAPQLGAVDGADAMPELGTSTQSAEPPSTGGAQETDPVIRPPAPNAGPDRFNMPEMPQDQTIPDFPATTVPQSAPSTRSIEDGLDASLPQLDAQTAAMEAADLPSPSLDDLTAETRSGSIDTRSARVGSRTEAPTPEAPSNIETLTIMPVSAPNVPRPPRATLTTPESIFPDPVPLTLPTSYSAPAPPTPARDTAQEEAVQGEAQPAEDRTARLDALVSERETVGSLIDNRREAPTEAPEADAIAVAPADGPAFMANAAPFEPQSDLPLLAVILEDVGERGIPRSELSELGTRVTFAVSPERHDATRAQDDYRAAGFEVLVVVPSRGAMHIGAATKLDTLDPKAAEIFQRVPGAIGLIDRPEGNIFRSSRLVDGLAQVLNKTGHGLLIHEQFGANRTIEALEELSVPSASVLRVIDDQRNPDAIRRNLDRAALDASKFGGAVVFGRSYPETISALGIWSISRAGRSVQFAPVTATISDR